MPDGCWVICNIATEQKWDHDLCPCPCHTTQESKAFALTVEKECEQRMGKVTIMTVCHECNFKTGFDNVFCPNCKTRLEWNRHDESKGKYN